MASVEELKALYEGHIVPRSFNAGYVALSYVVSFIGAMSTLELINRRTAPRGLFNHILLVGSAVTMGGVAIWCMHFIGSLAIVLADGEHLLQIVYSSKITAASFFVPIIVLVIAFVAIGAGSQPSWIRVIGSGVLAGIAICGMHYLGNASIANYTCIYQPGYVVGAALIAVAASTIALFLFFVYRAAWANSWWKTLGCGVLLAGGVSGMHWCAAVGTAYRLKSVSAGGSGMSRTVTVIVVIALSVATCLIMAGTAIYTARVRRQVANKAQQVVLASVIYDQHGRILVNRNGLLPSEKITDTFIDKTSKERFDSGSPLFQWMFQASRNWSGIQPLLDGMMNHLAQLPRQGRDRDARTNINLVSEHGEVVKKFDVIFRELLRRRGDTISPSIDESLSSGSKAASKVNIRDIEKEAARKKKSQGRATGSLMLLVKQVQSDRDVERLGAAGYRFADVNQVAAHITTSMQIKDPNFENKLQLLANYSDTRNTLEPGPHVGLFAIRPRSTGAGYDIIVRKRAKNLLPSVPLPVGKLTSSHIEFLRRLDRASGLCAWVGDKCIEEARLTAKLLRVPNFVQRGAGPPPYSTMIALRVVIPAESRVVSANCSLVPLSFFKVRQLTAPGNASNAAFTRAVHRELGPIINSAPKRTTQAQRGTVMFGNKKLPGKLRIFRKDGEHSTLKLWGRRSAEHQQQQHGGMDSPYDKPPPQALSMLGGIMISQEVTVAVHSVPEGGGSRSSDDGSAGERASHSSDEGRREAGIELAPLKGGKGISSNIEAERFSELVTFVDELYALCVERTP
ncbi:unnamed protein product [Parascedosporium putredinis]|uniref:MHYT domain-containing protein n=1 Tax=Parascedosporium putredinis TaxID=1442378 RepID=A0A9P1M7Z1_9PEZI|nr:unnamed protein product [Parascedosporium putredinis]CAI7991546.1 unnamed protein product [Parascedosporium putredinis]